MKIKKSMFVLLAAGLLTVTGCNPTTSSSTSSAGHDLPNGDGETINMSVMYQKSGTRMKYATDDTDNKVFTGDDANGYTHNGVTYQKGDWKPVWKAVQDKLSFTINDSTPTSATKIADGFSTLQTNGCKHCSRFIFFNC